MLLLCGSLGLKFWRSDAAAHPVEAPATPALFTSLSDQGFTVAEGSDLEGASWRAFRETCRIDVTAVSPLGWHQAAMIERARDQTLAFTYLGEWYEQQPVWLTKLGYYWHKLASAFHAAQSPPVYAVLLAPGCERLAINMDLIASNLS